MNHLTIQGFKPYDGRYEFDVREREFTIEEWGWIKRQSGYLPLTLDEGLDGMDAELVGSFACIALYRAGKVEAGDVPAVFERLKKLGPFATITLEGDQAAEPEEEPDPSLPPSSTGNGNTSGHDGATSSASSDATRPATGTPASATSVSAPATSVT